MPTPETSLSDSVAEFIRDPESHDFDDLARRAFTSQYRRSERYRQLCQLRGVEPDSVRSWRDIPPIAIASCRNFFLEGTAEPQPTLNGGTADAVGLGKTAIDASWPKFCLDQLTRPPILSLLTSTGGVTETKLSWVVDHVLDRWGDTDSIVAVDERGIDARRARGFLAARQRDSRPILVLATSRTLGQLVDSLERLDLRFRLSTASVVVEIGVSGDKVEDLFRAKLHRSVEDFLAIPPNRVVLELGAIELTSQLFTDVIEGGDPEVLVPPHWVRVVVVEPESQRPSAKGEPGRLCIFDLANLGSAVHIETELRGIAESGGFRLFDRET